MSKRTTWALVLAALLAAGGCAELGEESVTSLGTDGYVDVGGGLLFYATQGSGPPVIMLHGGPGVGQLYLVVALGSESFPPQDFRWVAYDQRGSGRSTGGEDPSRLTIEQFVEDLDAVRAATGERRVALLGHSFGGLLALHYAVRYPDRVTGMILLDPDPASRELWARHEEIVESRRTAAERAELDSISSVEGWELDPLEIEAYHLVRLRPYFGRQEAWPRLMLGLRFGVYGNFPNTALAVRESLGDWDIFEALTAVEAPTLIITGDRSPFPLSAHEMLREALPNGELVVLPGVGHFPHMEDPDGFSRAANAFLDSLSANAQRR